MTTAELSTFPPVYRALGLSIAASYALLGSSYFASPVGTLTILGLTPDATTSEADASLEDAMLLLGARDLSISAAIFYFYARGEPRNMGIVILSGMFLCAVDVLVVWRRRRDWVAAGMGVGATIWGLVGWELVRL